MINDNKIRMIIDNESRKSEKELNENQKRVIFCRVKSRLLDNKLNNLDKRLNEMLGLNEKSNVNSKVDLQYNAYRISKEKGQTKVTAIPRFQGRYIGEGLKSIKHRRY